MGCTVNFFYNRSWPSLDLGYQNKNMGMVKFEYLLFKEKLVTEKKKKEKSKQKWA